MKFRLPSDFEIALGLRLLEPWRRYTDARFDGWENIPDDQPLLFVGNHTTFGILDAPLMFAELWREKHIYLRALGDHVHFKIPGWAQLLNRYGVVDGNRETCAALMETGAPILVYPGGGREVAKRRGEKYQLIWKERRGFARMAIAHGYTILPFAAIGAEDCFDIVYDANDLMRTPIGRILERLPVRDEIMLPIGRGVGGTPIPRPARLYFRFLPPIPTAHLGGDLSDASLDAIREQTRVAVEEGMQALLEQQSEDGAVDDFGEAMRRALPAVLAGDA